MFFKVPFYRVIMPVHVDSCTTAIHDFNSMDEAQSFFDSELERLSSITNIDGQKFDVANMSQDQVIEIEHERFQQILGRASIETIGFPKD